ncbi:hypothetical protein L8106_00005 [Lyngbya sp. PCC 8106]|nr:hypothetical protein L8106_00005 [Lyngbya sp. PCC 8106]
MGWSVLQNLYKTSHYNTFALFASCFKPGLSAAPCPQAENRLEPNLLLSFQSQLWISTPLFSGNLKLMALLSYLFTGCPLDKNSLGCQALNALIAWFSRFLIVSHSENTLKPLKVTQIVY